MINLEVIKISTLQEASREIEKIGCDRGSVPIMAPKAIARMIKLYDISSIDAIIIKQDMLSVGGDVAIPRDTYFGGKDKKVDILVIGTIKQIRELIEKLKRQHPRIQNISRKLEEVLEGES